jgi:isopropylmalate/homocitrate/citramalate synthase
LGKKSGKDSISIKRRELGLFANEEKINDILQEVKKWAQKTKEPIGDKEFTIIVDKILNGGKKDNNGKMRE